MTQTACKEGEVSESSGSMEHLPLLADLVLYYCRHADQPVLVQLYQAEVSGSTHTVSHFKVSLERHSDHQLTACTLYFSCTQLTLAGGEKRREVFIHSLELGHSAGTRAVKAMGESHSDRHTQTATSPPTYDVTYTKCCF